MSELPVLDPESIESLRALGADGDDSFLKEIIGIFIDDTPVRLKEMRDAFAANDQATFSRAAHSIKGSSSNLGALRLRALAEMLERSSKTSDLTGLDAELPKIEAEFAIAKVELEKL
jgi:HPt (histidine-containing phosphotransfer) domain-containing protein